MKKCAECFTEVSKGATECPNCGNSTFIDHLQEEAQISCQTCGERNPRRRSTCSNCGRALVDQVRGYVGSFIQS